jgi:Cu(I)/Ag(I) efflux system membrane fusion protein
MNDSPMSWRSRLRGVSRGRQRITVALALVLVAGASWMLACKQESRAEARGRGGESKAGVATGSDSMPGMDVGRTSTRSGDSGRGSVHLSASQIREFGITYDTVGVRPFSAQLRTVGTVVVDETKLSQIAPRFDGYVDRLYVEATGQQVRRGQPLMDVYSPELLAAEQELLVAGNLERSLGESAIPGVPTSSPELVTAAKHRLELWGISDAQIAEILRTGKATRTLTLHAPTTGIVLQKNVVQGQAIQAGQTLYTIADLSDVWIEAQLREQDAGSVEVGAKATAQLASFPGRPVSGRVAYVYPTIEAQARTATARIVIPNPEGLLKPGMYATVALSTPSRSALSVPASAVLNTGDRSIVFVDMGKGELMPHDVVVGRVAGEYAEVLSGVERGQRVVTSAQFLLDSESNLAEVMRSMIGQIGATDTGDMQNMPGMDMSGQQGGMPSPRGDSAGMNDKGADVKGMKAPPSPATPRR